MSDVSHQMQMLYQAQLGGDHIQVLWVTPATPCGHLKMQVKCRAHPGHRYLLNFGYHDSKGVQMDDSGSAGGLLHSTVFLK